MKATDLYAHLEDDFIFEGMWDVWAENVAGLEEFLSPNFIERSMGLMCDFASDINKVYTAVFPSDSVVERMLADGASDAMLFVHHAAIWDIRRVPPFYQTARESFEAMRELRISLFNLHVPLDNFGEYATTKTLADALGIEIEKPFAAYCGGLAGVIGKTACKTVEELSALFTEVIGHETTLYVYGDSQIQDGRVAVVAGGGNDIEIVPELLDHEVRVLVTGIAVKNDFSAGVHAFEEEHRINVLGGTHYSTERFACQKMCSYFEKLGLPSVFIEDTPVFEDM